MPVPWIRVPPARSPIHLSWLLSTLRTAAGGAGRFPETTEAEVVALLEERFGAEAVHLTDSGTGALTLALAAAFEARGGNHVALPGYACYSIATAVVGAGGRASLYDLDPVTLSPDPDSVERILRSGVDVLVVAPLYGYPIDIEAMLRLAERSGALVVEDAAQGTGGQIRGRRSGSIAPLSTLSFGRGKGISCGNGGALLVKDPGLLEISRRVAGRRIPRGADWEALLACGGEELFGRPSLYGLPASLPSLALGETRYSPPVPVGTMGRVPMLLLREALDADVRGWRGGKPFGYGALAEDHRRERAVVFGRHLEGVPGVETIRPIPGALPGALRFPFLVRTGRGSGSPKLGVAPGYPATLAEIEPFRPHLFSEPGVLPGASRLASTLLTAPTHHRVPPRLAERIADWVRSRALDGEEWAPGPFPFLSEVRS